jgi:hypothetical protein
MQEENVIFSISYTIIFFRKKLKLIFIKLTFLKIKIFLQH